MTAIESDLLTSLLENEDELGNPTFTWLGKSYSCLPNVLSEALESNAVGYGSNGDFRMRVRLDQFNGSYPYLKDFITYMEQKLMVKEIKKPVHGVFWVYVCEKAKV